METKRIRIVQDTFPTSPREWCNVGTMVCEHDRYRLGDVNDFKPWNASNWKEHMAEYFQNNYNTGVDFTDYDNYDKEVDRVWNWIDKNIIYSNLYLYDHSGISISCGQFNCKWDSGQVGFIYCTKETAVKEWGKKICTKEVMQKAIKYMEGEVDTYDQYLRGDVYGFIIETWNPEPGCGWETEDSCSGFYGDDMKTNGIEEHIPQELHYLLDDVEVEY